LWVNHQVEAFVLISVTVLWSWFSLQLTINIRLLELVRPTITSLQAIMIIYRRSTCVIICCWGFLMLYNGKGIHELVQIQHSFKTDSRKIVAVILLTEWSVDMHKWLTTDISVFIDLHQEVKWLLSYTIIIIIVLKCYSVNDTKLLDAISLNFRLFAINRSIYSCWNSFSNTTLQNEYTVHCSN